MDLKNYIKDDENKDSSEFVVSNSSYRPKDGFIKCFSTEGNIKGTQVLQDDLPVTPVEVINDLSNPDAISDTEQVSLTTPVQGDSLDSSDSTVISVDDDISCTDEELVEFINYLAEMARTGNVYTIISFSKLANKPAVKQFSNQIRIKDYIKDKLRNPRITYAYRIRQFITYVNTVKPEVLSYSLYYAVQYLKEYFEQYITSAMNGLTNSNILLGLGINRWIKDKQSVRLLQRTLRKAAVEINTIGAMQKLTQQRLWNSFKKAFFSLIEGISFKIKDPVKRDLIMAAVTGASATNKSSELEMTNAVNDQTQIQQTA